MTRIKYTLAARGKKPQCARPRQHLIQTVVKKTNSKYQIQSNYKSIQGLFYFMYFIEPLESERVFENMSDPISALGIDLRSSPSFLLLIKPSDSSTRLLFHHVAVHYYYSRDEQEVYNVFCRDNKQIREGLDRSDPIKFLFLMSDKYRDLKLVIYHSLLSLWFCL